MPKPLSIIPGQRGAGVYNRLQQDDSTSESETDTDLDGVADQAPIFITLIGSDAEYLSVQEQEQAFLDDDIDLEAAMAPRPRRTDATAPATTFEAIDWGGDIYMQEMPLPPTRRAAHLSVTGSATTPRTGRLAHTVGWGIANNLTHAQATVLERSKETPA